MGSGLNFADLVAHDEAKHEEDDCCDVIMMFVESFASALMC